MSKEVKELLDRLDIVPQSRDRRPRLSACKSLNNIPLGYIPLLFGGLGRLLFAVFWRTDEGVCPYFVALYPTEIITILPL